MSIEDVRDYEKRMQEETNEKVNKAENIALMNMSALLFINSKSKYLSIENSKE